MSYEIDNLKQQLKGLYFAWVGQNASTGTPNRITGNYSMYGSYVAFDNKHDRDQFVEDYYDPNGNKYAVAGGIRKMREYSLGSTMYSFLQDLYYAPFDGEY